MTGRTGGALERPEVAGVRARESIEIARAKGLVGGPRTVTVRGRMDAALVAEAKRRTGISSDTELLEAALATLAVADDYGEWLIGRKGTVDAGLDLEI